MCDLSGGKVRPFHRNEIDINAQLTTTCHGILEKVASHYMLTIGAYLVKVTQQNYAPLWELQGETSSLLCSLALGHTLRRKVKMVTITF